MLKCLDGTDYPSTPGNITEPGGWYLCSDWAVFLMGGAKGHFKMFWGSCGTTGKETFDGIPIPMHTREMFDFGTKTLAGEDLLK